MVSKKYTSTPIKNAIVRAGESGQSVSDVAQLFQVGSATVKRICARHRQEGNVHR